MEGKVQQTFSLRVQKGLPLQMSVPHTVKLSGPLGPPFHVSHLSIKVALEYEY